MMRNIGKGLRETGNGGKKNEKMRKKCCYTTSKFVVESSI